ncbi:MAG: hypothetical protein HRU12_22265, partial [Phaeodactylibacter sp.]|nr:hypothetical protein [Phaeodactylibacter sp.]
DKKTAIKELENEIVEIELKYIGMMCDCLQWATPENIELYEKSIELGSTIPMDSLFLRIESSNDSVMNPFELEYIEPVFKFTGQFYKGKHKWISEDGNEYYCKVFRYDKCITAK